jgi:hypothetical protein
MKQLIDLGLFTLCPALEDASQWVGWAIPVVNIRNEFNGPAKDTDKKNIRTAITMAQACFGSRWALPIAIMLLSLQHRKYDDRTILDGFGSMFTGRFSALLPGFRCPRPGFRCAAPSISMHLDFGAPEPGFRCQWTGFRWRSHLAFHLISVAQHLAFQVHRPCISVPRGLDFGAPLLGFQCPVLGFGAL